MRRKSREWQRLRRGEVREREGERNRATERRRSVEQPWRGMEGREVDSRLQGQLPDSGSRRRMRDRRRDHREEGDRGGRHRSARKGGVPCHTRALEGQERGDGAKSCENTPLVSNFCVGRVTDDEEEGAYGRQGVISAGIGRPKLLLVAEWSALVWGGTCTVSPKVVLCADACGPVGFVPWLEQCDVPEAARRVRKVPWGL